MFSSLRRLVGAVKVTEDQILVNVEGVPGDLMARDISKIWNTGRINQYMFARLGRNSFSFPKFFAPEVHFALKRISEEKGMRSRKGQILGIVEALEQDSWLKQINEEHPSILDYSQLSQLTVNLLDHQRNFLQVYDDIVPKYGLKGYLLAADPGSGKTLNSLGLSLALRADYVIIVSPKNALYRVWRETIQTRFKQPQTLWIAADGVPYKGQKYIVVHYEALNKVMDVARQVHGKVVVILDESHHFNETTSQRTNLFVDMCRTVNSEHVLWMSGTPLKAMAYESIPLLRTVDPLFTPQAEERYKKIFGKDVGRAVDILKNRLGIVSYKVVAGDVIHNKTSTKEIKVKIPDGHQYTLEAIRTEMTAFIKERMEYYRKNMSDYQKNYKEALSLFEATLETSEQKKAFSKYKDCVSEIRKGYDPLLHKTEAAYANHYETKVIIPALPTKEWRDIFKDTRSVIKYVDLKVMGEALGRVLGKKRSECHAKMVHQIDFKEIIDNAPAKTVIFTSYVEVVKEISKVMKTKGYQPLEVYGETNANVSGIITEFEKNEKKNPLVATYQSLSTAVPLVMASDAIFINQPFRDYEMKQARARLDRLGQLNPVTFYNIILDTGKEKNISTRSQEILEWSKDMVEAMMGGEEDKKAVDKTLDTYYNEGSMEAFVDHHNPFEISFESYLDQTKES